ncbi:MAG: transporter [Bacteroidota bacterium]
MKLSCILLLISCMLSINSGAQQMDTAECKTTCTCGMGTFTPLGIMTDHVHPKGEWMVSYTYMNMMMNGNIIGDKKTSDNTVYQKYSMAPESMSMQMHMLMLMYGLNDRLTMMLMQGFTMGNMSMNMDPNMPNMPGMTPGDTRMSTLSSGFTDTKIFGLYMLADKENYRVVASMGINIPTGTIRATGTTMLGNNQRLPYNMQVGNGNWGIMPDVTYMHQCNKIAWGTDAGADIKLANNSLGYRQGNVYHITIWGSYKFLSYVSGSLRAENVIWDRISGSDPAIDIPIYVKSDPTANTANYGGNVTNIYAGLNFHFPYKVFEKMNLLLEYGMPVYQNLNGTQMANLCNLQIGLQYKL